MLSIFSYCFFNVYSKTAAHGQLLLHTEKLSCNYVKIFSKNAHHRQTWQRPTTDSNTCNSNNNTNNNSATTTNNNNTNSNNNNSTTNSNSNTNNSTTTTNTNNNNNNFYSIVSLEAKAPLRSLERTAMVYSKSWAICATVKSLVSVEGWPA